MSHGIEIDGSRLERAREWVFWLLAGFVLILVIVPTWLLKSAALVATLAGFSWYVLRPSPKLEMNSERLAFTSSRRSVLIPLSDIAQIAIVWVPRGDSVLAISSHSGAAIRCGVNGHTRSFLSEVLDRIRERSPQVVISEPVLREFGRTGYETY